MKLNEKYRPKLFSEVIDQEPNLILLKGLLKKREFSTPVLFSGYYGGGKTSLARIFARAILCKNLTEDMEPCNECSSCLSFLEETNLAYKEIDGASNSGVDEVRKLKEEAQYKSLGEGEQKVVVIDECHNISSKGMDAFLKQLEDNKTNQVYIFCTTEPESLEGTVRSRCFEIVLCKNTKESISNRLEHICKEESFDYEKKGLELIAELHYPSVRDSIKSIEYLSLFGKINEKSVSDYFNLEIETDCLYLLQFLHSNVSESSKILKNMLSFHNATRIYEGMIRGLLNTLKLTQGVNSFRSKTQVELATNIGTIYGTNLAKILEELLKRNKYSDNLTLEADLYILHQKLNSSFTSPLVYTCNAGETPAIINGHGEIVAASIPDKPAVAPEEVKELIPETLNEQETPSEEPLEEPIETTTKILKRYPAYPQKLAVMMEKSKKSSSENSESTVELKEVKDFKRNINKSEIKALIDSKRDTS